MGKVRVGFIGVGGIASVHLKNISSDPNAEIIAVCDINEESALKVGQQYRTNWYTNIDEMLEKESIDATFVCVPPFAHGDIEEKLVAKGIHMLVEKPIGLDIETVKEKEKVIKESGLICAVGYCLRYLDTVQKAKEYLADKTIAMVRGYYLSGFVPTPWFRDVNKSGGQLVEQATHTVDLVRYLAGDINRVYADMSLTVLHDIPNINIPDVTSVNVHFETGAVGHIDCTNIQPDHRSGLEILGHDFRVEIDGTSLIITEKDSTTTYRSKVDFYQEQDKRFIEAVKDNDNSKLLSTYEDALKTLDVTLAANKSAEDGQPVTLTSTTESIKS